MEVRLKGHKGDHEQIGRIHVRARTGVRLFEVVLAG